MTKEQSADNVNIFQLPTRELIDVYRKLKVHTDSAEEQIMMRAARFEQAQRENDKLVRLLRECVPYLEQMDETDLQSRVIDALAEYQEQS